MFCNPAACRTFEIDPPGCQGQPLDAVIHHQEVLELFPKTGARRAQPQQ